MTTCNNNEELKVIIGFGQSGLACARYFLKNKIPFLINDTRDNPPLLQHFLEKEYSNIEVEIKTGGLDSDLIAKASELVVAPGLSLKEPEIEKAMALGIPVVGDVELFVRVAKAPICAITGSNAKSTVTALVNEMARYAGVDARMGGNIGKPVLDLLDVDESSNPDLYILELSSFQLETTHSLKATAATILNISEDHMDRYDNIAEYISAKQKIYRDAEYIICNRQDEKTLPSLKGTGSEISFGLDKPAEGDFGLMSDQEDIYFSFGHKKLLLVNECYLKGSHNQQNALAALALGYALKFPFDAMCQALREFKGLPHRCQWVANHQGVDWYNDSKGTNIGATIAAVEGFGYEIRGKIVLIAGGVGKSADFSQLRNAIKEYVSTLILIGEDAEIIAKALESCAEISFATSLKTAVSMAAERAQSGDVVLLSPACASFDMFENFEARGDAFVNLVRGLL